jgi:hypothetical protein
MFDQLFLENIPEVGMTIGEEEVTVKRVSEFDNGTVTGGKMIGYDHNNLDEFLKETGYEYYLISGRYNCFISHVDFKTGYKFFATDKTNHTPADDNTMQRMFDIHNDLYKAGFGPKPYELLPNSCMLIEKSIGSLEKPSKDWVSAILKYCKEKGIYRNTNDAADLAWEVQKRTNVINTSNGYHFIDIDYKVEYYDKTCYI